MGARSVVQAVFFGLSNHVVEGCVGDGILPVAILEHIDEPHAPVGSNLSKWNLSCFEELDDEWAAYVEKFRHFGNLAAVVQARANLVSTGHVRGPYRRFATLARFDEGREVLAKWAHREYIPLMTPDHPTPTTAFTEYPKTRDYWISRTSAERFAEVERLRREKHGDEATLHRMERVLSFGRLGVSELEDNV